MYLTMVAYKLIKKIVYKTELEREWVNWIGRIQNECLDSLASWKFRTSLGEPRSNILK